ncbi:hypothetical protein TNIN_348181 [Trichonephila inaurata madagascariensis]|uniref:Uncharacterized protein n=1 Tax=Trichonephila inaurata madagascariensis TaxID=2747483 RepID=A0A8X7C4B3_9ARAC|nr:hypothetical protein TNIN_348181 [Trichonephila inaurata madagascariensis]
MRTSRASSSGLPLFLRGITEWLPLSMHGRRADECRWVQIRVNREQKSKRGTRVKAVLFDPLPPLLYLVYPLKRKPHSRHIKSDLAAKQVIRAKDNYLGRPSGATASVPHAETHVAIWFRTKTTESAGDSHSTRRCLAASGRIQLFLQQLWRIHLVGRYRNSVDCFQCWCSINGGFSHGRAYFK